MMSPEALDQYRLHSQLPNLSITHLPSPLPHTFHHESIRPEQLTHQQLDNLKQISLIQNNLLLALPLR